MPRFSLIHLPLVVLTLMAMTMVVYYWKDPVSNQTEKIIPKCTSNVDQSVRNKKPTNYTVLSASVPDFLNDTITIQDGKPDNTDRAWGYLFLLPVTCLAWKRIGSECVVIITLDYSKIRPEAERLLRYVDKTLRLLDATVVYFDVPSNLKVRLGQVLRLIPGTLSSLNFNDDDFLTTGDADLFPINPHGYDVPHGKSITVYNAMCCGLFKFQKTDYLMFPLSHFIMRVKIWKKIFSPDVGESMNMDKQGCPRLHSKTQLTFSYSSLSFFMKRLEKYAEDEDLYRAAKHGGKLWYIDQVYGSVLLNNYINHVDNSSHFFIGGLGCQRFDVEGWEANLKKQHKCRGDAHVFKDRPWIDHRWGQLSLLTVTMFDNKTLNIIQNYRDQFKSLYDGN